LVVWRLSRLARSLKQIIETAHDSSKEQASSPDANIDTGTPEGGCFPYHAAFDDFSVKLIVKTLKAGLVAARKAGRRGGRPKVGTRRESASPSDAQGHGQLPVCRGCHRSTQDRETAFYRYFPQIVSKLRNKP